MTGIVGPPQETTDLLTDDYYQNIHDAIGNKCREVEFALEVADETLYHVGAYGFLGRIQDLLVKWHRQAQCT
jgi:hypothetical protein